MSVILQTHALSKRFGKGRRSRLALDNLNLQVSEGEIFGFVGPNGAGKTTTIRILTTLLQPTQGEAWIGGYAIRTQPRQVRRLIGYIPDFFGVYGDLQVSEYLEFFARCYGISASERSALIDDLLELVDLGHRRDDAVDTLSRGLKQRLHLARVLLHDPQLLILDEPAAGLDPRARVEIRNLLVELSRVGKTIFFSTHILSDVAEICHRVGILEAGKLIAVGSLSDLQHQIQPQRRITIEVIGTDEESIASRLAEAGLQEAQPAAENHILPGRSRWQGTFRGNDQALSAMLANLIASGLPVVHFSEQSSDIEDLFLQFTQGIVS